jgi:hypothetical protein
MAVDGYSELGYCSPQCMESSLEVGMIVGYLESLPEDTRKQICNIIYNADINLLLKIIEKYV